MTETAPASSLEYFRYRLNRDLGGVAGWFAQKWRASWLFKIAAVLIGLGIVFWIAVFVWLASDLPEAESLLEYETPLPTVVRGADGEIVHSYARERRVQLQYPDFPERLVGAYLSAEDKTFFSHGGVDVTGTANAVFDYATKFGSGDRAVGGSTITQQLAKILLLGDEYSVTRKLKEMILASRIEGVLSKQEILELYLNEIPLGRRSFGVQAAARAYFDKDVGDLELHEMAFLAILPKAPERYGRRGQEEAALVRRDFVLSQMEENGYISASERQQAASQPLGLATQRTQRSVDAGYFLEEVRRQLIDQFGENAETGDNSVYAGGLWVRTSLDPEIQEAARDALRTGLVRYHGRRGWGGPVANIDLSEGNWAGQLASSYISIGYKDWRVGVVTQRSGSSATIGFADGEEAPLSSLPNALKAGDVIVVRPQGSGFRVASLPTAQGGLVVQSPQTGRVVAMQGGFDHRLSDFNRATQAMRQPGSTIKPFVYATGLDNGMTPSTEIDNTRFCYYQGNRLGEKCIRGGRAGQFPMRYGLEQSQNIMTVQIGMQAGMENVVDTIEAVGIGEADPYAATALGSEETTVLRMVNAYSALANHGRLNQPTVIDYVQDRRGKVIWRADDRNCNGCNMAEWDGNSMPRFGMKGEQVMDARTAFQTMHMLEGVVDRGTATVLNTLGLPLFGKTGTTTGPKDVWFVGGTQQLIAGAYVGFDRPKNMGGYAQGGTIAAPIIKDLIQNSRERWVDLPAIAPAGVRMVRVDRRTGKRVFDRWPTGNAKSDVIWEAFKPDSEPERSTRQDEIAAKRDEILALIRASRNAGPSVESSDGQPEDFVEDQGGIY
ncbi:penicillin-binding protein 1A [Erythrobacter crassostreae]|uniref:Transglycosylase domain-containing protein n=1 Tax=Erythrobacter crassostreae TaxID=2828328 RepID=A0A9X1F5E8_9SPHN|nr:transglycosylase domain-containing protein [Erythrobacter crassostrea]MBV7260194.1 transglycosylase domain-containing protein [Erythrobacter crassostrea]